MWRGSDGQAPSSSILWPRASAPWNVRVGRAVGALEGHRRAEERCARECSDAFRARACASPVTS
eukprot:2703354-Pyramimonas_sp.AAC.1